MKLDELRSPGVLSAPKRKGRGPGSGNGKTAGRGHKGLGQRSGGSTRPGFEGGQTTMMTRLPKRGFNNKVFATRYAFVNVRDLERFASGGEVTPETLRSAGLVNKFYDGVKVLGDGQLTKKLTVKAAAFSASAREKIEAAGGSVEVV